MTYYEVLLFVHIVAAIVWVGGGIMINITGSGMVRSGDPAAMAQFAKQSERIGQRVIAPTALILVVMGLLMVRESPAWEIGDLWIVLALVLYAVSAVAGAAFFGPQAGKLGEVIQREGVTPEVMSGLRRLIVLGRVDLLVLVAVVALMVFKPGA